MLNNYFSSVFTKEDCSNIPEPKNLFEMDNSTNFLINIKITEETVRKKLKDLNVNKCPGLDELHPKMLFELRAHLVKPLTVLYTNSLDCEVVPADWKDAGVTPLFKKGKRADPQNYRPISLTCILGKMMESIIKDCILEHLDKHNLIKDSQHGFTKGRSCLSNLLEFMDEVTGILDEGSPVDIIYLDFAKAFDKVPYQRLFKKLDAHGIKGRVAEWVKNWLSARRQKVCLNKQYSDWKDVISGVPQGSVLGPLLFLIYINDLDNEILSKLGKFADDTKMCRGVVDEQQVGILRNDLNNIYKWSVDWQMLFNINKCTVIHMGVKNKKNDYEMGGIALRKSSKERDLGVIIDSNGKSTEQCVMAVKKANTMLGMIKRNIHFKSRDIIVKLYKALVRPKLEYCVQVWCPYLKKDTDLLERVQKRATKMIEGLGTLDYEERLNKCGLITLTKRRARGDLIQVFKTLKGIDRIDYRKFFTLKGINKTRGHDCRVEKGRFTLDIRKHFFTQRVVNAWNELPQSVVDSTNVNEFKNKLDKFDRYFREER